MKRKPESKPAAPSIPEGTLPPVLAESRRPIMLGGVRRRRLMNYPGNGSAPKAHRPGTKRALVVALLTRDEGATFVEVQEGIAAAFPGGEWDDRTTFEGIKLVSTALGYSLTEDPQTAVIRATRDDEAPQERTAADLAGMLDDAGIAFKRDA